MWLLKLVILGLLSPNIYAITQSNLLEGVKNNPQEAMAMCTNFRNLNSNGISASSEIAISQISTNKNITPTEAEILSIYVIGIHCPDVT